MRSGKIFSFVSFVIACGALGGGCASLAQSDGGSVCIGPQCESLDAARDQYVHDVVLPDQGAGGESGSVNPLCGHGCLPDDVNACTGATGPPEGGLDGGAPPDAAQTADGAPPGVPSDASAPVADAASESATIPAPDGSAARGCHVMRGSQGPVAACGPAGSGRDNDACISSEDCAPGYGCVNDGGVGVCRQFCCDGNGSCDSDHFCTTRTLKDDGSLQVPVCVLPDNCNLAQRPCSEADGGTHANPQNCACKAPGTACIVVGDGLTSCTKPPGSGKDGDPCPCAWGYVCSAAQNTCLRICSLSATSLPCPSPYRCQSSPFMPDYFGVCAGTPLDASMP